MLQSLKRKWLAISLSVAVIPLAAYSAERPNLSGSWQWNPSQSDFHAGKLTGLTWVIDQADMALRISEIAKHSDGKEVKSALDCTTDGKECSVKEGGQAAKVSFWFNGATLVEMESKGHNHDTVVKKKLELSADGKKMTVEVIPIVGAEPSGKMVFEKQ
jgi:hypothetical protein